MFCPQDHDLDTLGRARRLDIQHPGPESQRAVCRREQRQLGLLVHRIEERDGRRLVRVCAGQAAAVGLGREALERKARCLAVLKDRNHAALIVSRQQRKDRHFALVHSQLGRQIIAQYRRFAVVKVMQMRLVCLLMVGQEHDLGLIAALGLPDDLVAVLELVLGRHPPGGRRNLLKVAVPGQEYQHGVIFNMVGLIKGFDRIRTDDIGTAGRRILFDDILQLLDDDTADFGRTADDALQLLNLSRQRLGLLCALEDILLIDMPQLDLGDEFGLRLINAETNHQIRDDLGVLLGLADDLDCPVNIQQDLAQALQQMQLGLLFAQVKVDTAAHAACTPGRPLLQQGAHAQHAGHAPDEHIEVARTGVHQRRHAEQPVHELVRVSAALEVYGDLEAAQVRFVTDIRDFPDLAGLDQLGHLIDDRLDGRGVWDLRDLDEVLFFEVAPLAAHLEGAAPGLIDLTHLGLIQDDLAAGREIRRRQGGHDIVIWVFDAGNGRAADLMQVKAAERGCHADGDAGIGRDQDVGEGRRQQGWLLHRAVVVIYHVDRVAVDVAEQLNAERIELGLGVTRGRISHIPRIYLAEVAFGIDKRGQKRLIAPGQAHHRLIDGRVAVRIQFHGLADDIGRFGAVAGQQALFVHGVQQLPMGRLKPIDLRDGARDNDAHRIGHIVCAQGLGDGLLGRFERRLHRSALIGFLLFCHEKRASLSKVK